MPFEEKKILSHSGGSIDGELSIELINYLFSDPEFRTMAENSGMTVYPASSFRHIAVQTGADIKGIRLIPPHDHLVEIIVKILPSGCDNAETLKALMKKANEVLDHHPINEERRKNGKAARQRALCSGRRARAELDSFQSNSTTTEPSSLRPVCTA